MAQISKNLLLFLSIVAMVAACEKYTYIIEPPDTETPVSYSEEIQPIFEAKFVRCHSGTLAPDLRSENSYKALSEGGYLSLPVENSRLWKEGIASASHISYTSQAEKDKIYAWLFQGAQDTIKITN